MKEMETCYCVHAFALSVFAFFVSCPFSFTLLSCCLLFLLVSFLPTLYIMSKEIVLLKDL